MDKKSIDIKPESITALAYLYGRTMNPSFRERFNGGYTFPKKIVIHRSLGVPQDFEIDIYEALQGFVDYLRSRDPLTMSEEDRTFVKEIIGASIVRGGLSNLANLIRSGHPVPRKRKFSGESFEETVEDALVIALGKNLFY